MHFFNPAQIMKLVEVVHTVSTSPDVTATVQDLCAKVGKVAVTCGDRSGFIVNALLFPYLNDAVRMLEANYASADDIDTAMKTGCGLPMGPFELLDVVGLDVSLAIERELYTEFREPGYAPGAAARAPGHRRLPRPQVGPRVPHLRLTRHPPGRRVENTPCRVGPGRRVLYSRPVDRLGSVSTPAAPSTPAGTGTLPQRARVVVIGGGVIGTSIAYHLAHLGVTDVLLLERDRLTSGTTWHAAGLMTCFGSTSETNTALRLYSRDLYARLEAETGVATGFKRVGLIEAAADADRLHEYRRVAAFQRHARPRGRGDRPARDGRAVPAGPHRRPARRLPRARRRPGQPGRRHDEPGPRRPEPRGARGRGRHRSSR